MAYLIWPKGVFLPFFGTKFKLIFLSIFDGIFSIKLKELATLGSKKKFQPQHTSSFQLMAYLSWPKGVFLPFFGPKFQRIWTIRSKVMMILSREMKPQGVYRI